MSRRKAPPDETSMSRMVTQMKITLALAAVLLASTAASAQTLYQVAPGVANGVLNIRRGPSADYSLLGGIPPGALVNVYRCVPPQDNYSKADWCEVEYQGARGWASTTGMAHAVRPTTPLAYPYAPPTAYIPPAPTYAQRTPTQLPTYSYAPPPAPAYEVADWVCSPSITITKEDSNPVRLIKIHAEGTRKSLLRIRVSQVLLDGTEFQRTSQYANDFKVFSDSEHNKYGWTGTYVKDPNVFMRAEFSGVVYTEIQYKFGVMQFSVSTPCVKEG